MKVKRQTSGRQIAPWAYLELAEACAERVAAMPLRFGADHSAWRLGHLVVSQLQPVPDPEDKVLR